MIPAGYWGARFDGADKIVPLVCWALIESEGETKIKGMVAAEYQRVYPAIVSMSFFAMSQLSRILTLGHNNSLLSPLSRPVRPTLRPSQGLALRD